MKKRFFSILLVLAFSIGAIGCGNAKSDNLTIFEPATIDIAQADTESVSEVSIPEAKTDSKVSSKGYSGSTYTLPVGSKSEAWTESQLDDYLADCKPYLNSFTTNEKGNIKVDLDQLMKDFGFEYVGTNDEGYLYAENIYWMKRGDLKIVVTFTQYNDLYVLCESPSSSSYALLAGVDNNDEKVRFRSTHLNEGNGLPKTATTHFKGVAACLKYVSQSMDIDCGRMPYPSSYRMIYAINGQSFNLTKGQKYMSSEVELDSADVYK